MKKIKAVSLMSGGLDSTLATRLVLDQGIEIQGLYLSSPFGCHENVTKVATHLQIPLKIVDKGEAYIELIRNPKYGYGKNMNPCIDCRIYMFVLAHKVMEEVGADFIVTGEVLGQRPMSQRKNAMEIIDRDSEMESLILRPLSAQNLPPTRPELEGWVDRERLLSISGRSRVEQMKWAEALQLKEYAAPAGGCLLTDENFSVRLSEFFKTHPDPTMAEIRLLRYGRHFHLTDGTRLIVGRNQEENLALREASSDEVSAGRMAFFQPAFPAPVAVLWGTPTALRQEESGKWITQYAKKGLQQKDWIEVVCGEERSQIGFYVDTKMAMNELPMMENPCG